ncbi:hypothetical protein [Paracerasibacillus soli]|uniref:Uncharacterized protein n=1 Tax=Paracerasibacillus soli TaxID=480284 RepID=A0ABU5CS25_9BACI|nr:hypothetical protein [Virgibacillus soli]MDY0409168.1 hypothetical protein [Virgibacillus soli]
MFKKLSTIFLVFLIALYPTVVFADSVVGENEAASEDNVTESQQDVTENEDTIEEEVAQDVEMEEAEVDSEELVVSEVEKLASEEESQEQQEIEVEETEEVVAETSKDHTVQNGAEVSTVQNDEGLSVADDNPALDLQGSIVGKAEFDEEKGYYVLDVTVTAQNQTETSTEGLYVGFKVPENVSVLDTEITPEDLKLLRLDDGSTAVAVKLPEMTTDAEHSITYTIPVFGVSDDRIVDNVINVYAFDENGYHPVGHFSGSIDVDFTAMNLRWDFKAKSQLIKDYPGLEGNQFGLRFSFEAMNLSIHSEEQVKIKFDVPEEITVHEPDQYIGSLDIEWDGNTATIDSGNS